MRKLREVAVVALMVGSVGMLGAGTAAAHAGKSSDGHKATSYSAKSQDGKKAKRAKKGMTAQDGTKAREETKEQKDAKAQDDMSVADGETAENGTVNGQSSEQPPIRVNNSQRLDCDYENNNVFLPVNVAISIFGDAKTNQTYGNTCPQTGPSFE